MLVHQVMTTNLHCVSPTSLFEEILNILVQNKISGVPVVNGNNKFVGIISEKDLLLNLFPSPQEFYHDYHYYFNHEHIEQEAVKISHLTAQDLMTTDVITVSPLDHCLKACALLIIHRIRRLPVVEGNNKLVGIVTTNNLYRNYLQFLAEKTRTT